MIDLTPEFVSDINEPGGTILGTSRGEQDPAEMVDCLERMGINVLFVIGGDGTLRGRPGDRPRRSPSGARRSPSSASPRRSTTTSCSSTRASASRPRSRSRPSRSAPAHIEAQASPNGVGLVKLMGRHSGFIACYASLAKSDANFVLIPEVPFRLEGEDGFLTAPRPGRAARARRGRGGRGGGPGPDRQQATARRTDASGNARLGDIGVFLKQRDHRALRRGSASS